MEISHEIFRQQQRPRFGNANPERMQFAFWEWMIGDDEGAKAKGPWDARKWFDAETNWQEGPIWTFQRYGATRTRLPDGRLVCIGGEHEDFYDSDFYIYNDVIVFGSSGEIEVYGYPKDVFPPTDFHTATLIGDRIIIIGCLGYMGERRPGFTPIYELDLSEFRMSEVQTSGQSPGWIHRHSASREQNGMVALRGGQVVRIDDGKQRFRRNVDEYAFDPSNCVWRRLTKRKWPQYSVRQEDGGLFVLERAPNPESLIPDEFNPTFELGDEWRRARFLFKGAPVALNIGVREIEIVVEGELPEDACAPMAELIRSNIEVVVKRKCTVEALMADSDRE